MDRAKRIAEVRDLEVQENILKYVWMSFSDPCEAAGNRFLGVIVTVAYGLSDALLKTHKAGINPGGEIQAMYCELEEGEIFKDNVDRLIQLTELKELGYV